VYGRAQRGWLTTPQLDLFGVQLPPPLGPDDFRRECAAQALELLISRGTGRGGATLEELTEDVRIGFDGGLPRC